jgi:hypothetical protein
VAPYFQKLFALKVLRSKQLYPDLSRMYDQRHERQARFEEFATVETIRKLTLT